MKNGKKCGRFVFFSFFFGQSNDGGGDVRELMVFLLVVFVFDCFLVDGHACGGP